MDLETVRFLLSAEGAALLDHAGKLEGAFLSRLTTLRKSHSPNIAAAALELLDLRKRAQSKFSRADEMFFVREALEQASGEVVSSYRAKRYTEGSHVLDLACGIGGDTIGLARRCFVKAVDRDPVRVEMARRNLEVYGLSHRVEFVVGDVTEVPLQADAAFLDPARRSEGRRVVRLADLSPSLDFIHRLVEEIPNSAIKLSPASDDRDLDALDAEIEFLSVDGECREALAWFGGLKTADVRATILPAEMSMVRSPVDGTPIRLPAGYLYEPDACVIRAHLVEQLAQELGASRIDERIAYLTSETLVETPFADAYEIIDVLPFNLKRINRRLRELGAGKVIVKKRGVPFEPREIERRLKLDGKTEFILVITRIGDKPWSVICSVAGRGGHYLPSAE